MQVFSKTNWSTIKILFFFVFTLFLAFLPVSSLLFFIKNDAFTGYFPPKFFMSESLRDGYLPMWNPYINFGFPQYGDMSGGFWSPITWLIASTVGYTAYSFTLEVFLYLFIGALGMYKLTAHFNIKKGICIAAAIVFMCCGYHTGHLQHFNWLSGSAFLPWCCFAYLLLVKSPSVKNVLLNVVVFYLFISSAHPGIIIGGIYFFVALALFLFFSNAALFTKSNIVKKILVPQVAFVLLLMIVSLGMIVGYADIIPHFVRGTQNSFIKGLEDYTSMASWQSLVFPLATMKNDAWFVSDLSLRDSYIGLPFLLFFLLSLSRKKTAAQQFFVGVALFFFLLSTVDMVEIAASKILPLIGYVRLKGEFRIFSIFSMIIVAAFEADRFFKEPKKNCIPIQKILWGMMILVAVTSVWAVYMSITKSSFFHFSASILNQPSVTDSLKIWLDHVSYYDCFWMQGLVHLPILWALQYSLKTTNLSLLLKLVAVDMIVATLLVVPFTGAGKARLHDVNQLLQTSPKGIPIPPLQSIYQNDTVPTFQNEWIGSWSMFNKQIGSIKEVPYPIQLKNRKSLYEDRSGRNKDAYFSKPFLFVKGNDSCRLQLQTFSPNKLDVHVNEAKIGDEMVIQQIFYPHWKAIVNGKPAVIAIEETGFMRVPLEAGKNYVTLSFEPVLVKRMMLISAIVFALLLLLLILLWLKPKSPSPSLH
jgi:hypothetical protein